MLLPKAVLSWIFGKGCSNETSFFTNPICSTYAVLGEGDGLRGSFIVCAYGDRYIPCYLINTKKRARLTKRNGRIICLQARDWLVSPIL